MSSDPHFGPSQQLACVMQHHLATNPVHILAAPCVLGSRKAIFPSMLLGALYGNARFNAACDFGIMNVAAHRHFSVCLSPSFCLHSLREGGGGIMALNILRICERMFVSAYRSQQILYCNEVMRLEWALATFSSVLTCNKIIEGLNCMHTCILMAI